MTYNIPEIKISVSFDKILKKSELHRITSSNDAYQIFKRVFNIKFFHSKIIYKKDIKVK